MADIGQGGAQNTGRGQGLDARLTGITLNRTQNKGLSVLGGTHVQHAIVVNVLGDVTGRIVRELARSRIGHDGREASLTSSALNRTLVVGTVTLNRIRELGRGQLSRGHTVGAVALDRGRELAVDTLSGRHIVGTVALDGGRELAVDTLGRGRVESAGTLDVGRQDGRITLGGV